MLEKVIWIKYLDICNHFTFRKKLDLSGGLINLTVGLGNKIFSLSNDKYCILCTEKSFMF